MGTSPEEYAERDLKRCLNEYVTDQRFGELVATTESFKSIDKAVECAIKTNAIDDSQYLEWMVFKAPEGCYHLESSVSYVAERLERGHIVVATVVFNQVRFTKTGENK